MFRRPSHPFAAAHDLTVPHKEAGADEHCGAGHRGEVRKSPEYGRADEHRPNHAAVGKWREQRGRREHESPDGEVLPERIAQPDPDQQKGGSRNSFRWLMGLWSRGQRTNVDGELRI